MERVAIYNRCSTEEENQKNALLIQAEESRELAEKMGWCVVAQYIEAQSGTTTSKRTAYQHMLEEMKQGKFDIIMIKSIDRLARNTKDWYLFLDCLTRNEIRLYLYLERKFYVSEDALVNGIKAILAEEFSKELSKKIKNSHKRRQEKGLGLNITREMYGFRKVGKDHYEIHELQAEYIRMALRLAENGYGYRRISNELYERGARSFGGTRISETQWRNILRSPRLYGTIIFNTTSYDFDKKKRRKVPKEQWIYVEHALPEIVSKEYHEKVMEILDLRKRNCERRAGRWQGKNQTQYSLSGKLICGTCGCVYYRTKKLVAGEERVWWKCSTYIKMGAKKPDGMGCSNEKLEEKQLIKRIGKAYAKRHSAVSQIGEKQLEAFGKLLEQSLQTEVDVESLGKLQKEYEKMQREEEVLLEKLVQGIVADEQFCSFIQKRKVEKQALERRIAKIKSDKEASKKGQNRSEKIRKEILTGELLTKTIETLAVEDMEKAIVHEKEPYLEILWNKNTPSFLE